jgi:hypothetical protein
MVLVEQLEAVCFLVGDLVMQNGSNTYIAFLMDGIICLLVAFCYCILSKDFILMN